MSYPKYARVGNQISEADMKMLYQLQRKNRKPFTRVVAEAVKSYAARACRDGENNGH